MAASAPRALLDEVRDAIGQAMQQPEPRERLARLGLQPDYVGGADFARAVARDFEPWGPLIRSSGFKPE